MRVSLHLELSHFRLFQFGLHSQGLIAHDAAAPMLPDFVKALVVVCLDGLDEVVQAVLVLWFHSDQAKGCCCLLVHNFAQPYEGTRTMSSREATHFEPLDFSTLSPRL